MDANIAQEIETACNCASPPNLHDKTPLAMAGNVVAKRAVGFGEPETVTVGALATGDVEFADVDPDARIVKRGETAYMTPCVELRKRRK